MNKRQLFYSIPVILLLIVAVAGWFATDYLGNKARQEINGESQASTLIISIHVSSTLNNLKGAVKSLAGSPWIASALLSKGAQDIELANGVLDRYNSALNASVSYLMDADGMTVASSNRNDPDSFAGKSYSFRPYFQEAAKGQPYRYFALGITSGKRGFYASYPVQNPSGKVLGVVTMKKDLDEMENFFSQFPHSFLINKDGIIYLSSSPARVLKSLWPLDKAVRDTLIASQQFGNKPFGAGFFKNEIADGTEVTLEGKDYFVSRKVFDSDGCSIVLLTPTDRVGIYKLIGILAAVSVSFLIVFFSGIIFTIDRSKEAIRQSEGKHRLLFDSAGDAIFVIDAEARMLAVNQLACERLGYTHAELMSMTISQVDSQAEAKHVPDRMARLMEQGHLTFETVQQRKDGSLIPTDVIARRITWDGQPAIMSSCRDITERKQVEEELRENRSRLEDIVSFLPDATLAIDKEKRVIIWNKAMEEMTGIPAAEMMGKGDYAYAIPFYGEARPQLMDLVFLDREEIAARYPKITREGDSITAQAFCNALYNNKGAWVFAKASPLHDQSGNIIGAIESIRDITEQKQAEEALQESESRMRAITNSAQDAILMMDPEGRISYWNHAAERILGYTSAEAIGQNLHALIAPSRYHEAHRAAFPVFQQKGQGAAVGTTLDLDAIRKDGKEIPVQLSLAAIHIKGAWNAVGVLRDITEQKMAEEKIRQMAYHDSLTGLPNRKLFSDRLDIALAHAQRNQNKIGIVMLDLDNFKDVNDTLGHDVGDLLLKATTERLKASLRKSDTVARFGGDEFLLILPDLKAIEDAIPVAQKIVDIFRKPFLIDTHKLVVTTSIGIAVYPDDGTDKDILLKNADIAMYQAKQAGRARYQLFKKT